MSFDVFRILQVCDTDQLTPRLNYRDPRTRKWENLDEFDELTRLLPLQSIPDIRLWTDTGEGSLWDFLSGDGYCGLMSERLCFEFAKYSGRCFQFLPVKVDAHPYYIPIRWEPLDCLDLDNATVDRGDSRNPNRITWIRKYKFSTERLQDPCAFCTPEFERGYFIFVTGSVKIAIEKLGVFGVEFELVDTVG